MPVVFLAPRRPHRRVNSISKTTVRYNNGCKAGEPIHELFASHARRKSKPQDLSETGGPWARGQYTLATLTVRSGDVHLIRAPNGSTSRLSASGWIVTSMVEALALRAGLPLKDARSEFTLHDELDVPAERPITSRLTLEGREWMFSAL